MAVNDKQFSAQQERVRKLAESYEGAEKKEVAELYIDRIAKLKTAIMESKLPDTQKEEYLKRLDAYLGLVDANNLQRLKKEYEPLLKSMESTLSPEVKEQAQDDRDAKLDDVSDLKIRQELLGEWREATKFKQKYDSKREQIDLLIKTKNLKPEGTELQYFMTALEFHTDFLNTKFQEYYDTKDVGQKHEKLKSIIDEGDLFYEVLTELEKRLQTVKAQEDLRVIDLNDRNEMAEQAMFIKRKRYDQAKKDFIAKLDAMKIPKNDPVRQHMEQVFEAADNQFDTFKDAVFTETNREKRTVAAETANGMLDQAISQIEGANKYLNAVNIKNAVDKGFSAVKIFEQVPVLKKMASIVPAFIMPQFAVGLGYYEAAHKGETPGSTALEVADFGISLVPFVGGAWDIVFAIKGDTISGRQMGTGERVLRGVIGVASLALDIFSFGVGGTLVRAGTKTVVKAGAEIAAKTAAKAALETGGKIVVKEGVEVGGRIVAKEGARVGEKLLVEGAEKGGEALARAGGESLAKGAGEAVVEGAAKEAGQKAAAVVLTDAQKEIILKGTKVGASSADRAAARTVLKEAITKSLDKYAAQLGEEQAKLLAKESERIAAETAKIATRKTTGVTGFMYRRLAGFSGGRFGAAGVSGLERGIVKAGGEKAAAEAAMEAGKEVGLGYFVKSEFVKNGEVLYGKMAGSVAKESGKLFIHMHNPLEVLKFLSSPVRTMSRLIRRVPRNLFQDKAAVAELEQSAKATLIGDGHNARDVEILFQEVKQKPWEQFLKENENNPLLKDPDVVEFFKGFQEQFPKSGLLEVKLGGEFPFVVGKGEEGKALTDLYRGIKQLEPDTLVAGRMLYDSRRMEWTAFYEKYKNNLRGATPEQLKAFEDQFKNLHSLNLELPVNVARIKEGRQAVRLSEAQIKNLQKELRALEAEKAQVEEGMGNFMTEYTRNVEAAEKRSGATVLAQEERRKIMFEMYEKLPDGPLKRAVSEYRDGKFRDLKLDVEAGSAEFREYTARAMEMGWPKYLADLDSRILEKQVSLTEAGIKVDVQKGNLGLPSRLKQKTSIEEVGEQQGKNVAAALAKEKQRQLIKKNEQDVRLLDTEKEQVAQIFRDQQKLKVDRDIAAGKAISEKEELELWYDVYTKLPEGPIKKAVDDIRKKNAGLMAEEGTAQWRQEMGDITLQQTKKRRDDIDVSLDRTRKDLQKARAGESVPQEAPVLSNIPANNVVKQEVKDNPLKPKPHRPNEDTQDKAKRLWSDFSEYLSRNKDKLQMDTVVKEMEQRFKGMTFVPGTVVLRDVEVQGKKYLVRADQQGKVMLEEEKTLGEAA